MITFKDVVNGDWIIKAAKQGRGKRVRITAQRRFHKADQPDFYQEWLTIDYVNRIRREAGLCKIQDSKAWEY